MNQLYKGKANYISVSTWALLLLAITLYGRAVGSGKTYFHRYLTTDTVPKNNIPLAGRTAKDSPVLAPKPVKRTDTIPRKADTSLVIKRDTMNFRMSKDTLDAPVVYHADDSMVLDIPGKKIILYGKETMVKYTDNELTAPHIEFDQRTSLVSAYLIKDSTGKVIAFPAFTQGDFKTVSDSIRFNMKNRKGITKGTYTQQGELFVYGEKIKKVEDDVFYAYRGRFTTCNLDTPHFAFVSKRIKFINKKMAFTGPVHPEVEGVPIPIYLPFGIYPLKQGRHSGILAPTFSANEQLGLSLENMGYYKVLSDRWDVILRGTIYSYGGWRANVNPRYYKRYHYQGNLGFDVQHIRDLDKAGSRSYSLNWTHSSDVKARPGVSFNANVNISSSKYNSAVPNNSQLNFQNLMNSSITYSKVWKNRPYNVTINAGHNQNNNTKLFYFNLPDIGFNVNTVYPFRRKETIGALKWYENLGVALNTNVKGQSAFYDTVGGFFNQFTKQFKWGAHHAIPLSLSLPPSGVFQMSPSVSYDEQWMEKKTRYSWNNSTKKLDTVVNKGFYTAREMSFSFSVATRIFGMFTFGKKALLKQVRHELRPQLSVSYKPDMNKQYWYQTQVDTFGNKSSFSVFQDNIYSGYGAGKFGGLNFDLDNILQGKIRNRKDTSASAVRKITLLDGLSFRASYNFLADSFQLSDFFVSARTNLFEKINITASGVINPYLTNDEGRRINKLIWNKRAFSLGTLTGGSLSLQTDFKGGDKKEKLPTNITNTPNMAQLGMPLNEYQQEAAYISNHPGEFANFNIPWSISLAYSLNYSRVQRADKLGFRPDITHSVTWNGTLNLTPKWQMGMSGSYNISQKQLGMLTMYVTREMHCWQMAINISPIGTRRYFTITINPKSSILRDLKINRTRQFYNL